MGRVHTFLYGQNYCRCSGLKSKNASKNRKYAHNPVCGDWMLKFVMPLDIKSARAAVVGSPRKDGFGLWCLFLFKSLDGGLVVRLGGDFVDELRVNDVLMFIDDDYRASEESGQGPVGDEHAIFLSKHRGAEC